MLLAYHPDAFPVSRCCGRMHLEATRPTAWNQFASFRRLYDRLGMGMGTALEADQGVSVARMPPGE